MNEREKLQSEIQDSELEGKRAKSDPKAEASVDLIKQYLGEIARVPLLSKEQEFLFSQRIKEGQTAQETLTANGFTEEEVARFIKRPNEVQALTLDDFEKLATLSKEDFNLLQAIQSAEEAKNKLVEANLRLVILYAKRYSNRGLDFEDLIQEGNIGLFSAAEKFDASKGFKFSTYATWWIKQAISRAISEKGRSIRLPVHMHEKISSIKRIENQLIKKLDREPDKEDLIEEIVSERLRSAIGDKQLNDEEILALQESIKLTARKEVENYYHYSKDIISLNMQVGGEGDSELQEFIEDKDQLSSEEEVFNNDLAQAVRKILDQSGLDERGKRIIEMRFGFNGEPMTLDTIGKEFGITRERVRQLEQKALRRLKVAAHYNQELKSYFWPERD